jgi:hypothetical protein
MNTARGPTRKKYLARTIQDFTTKVLNSLPIPKKFNRDAQFDPRSNGIRGTDGAIYNELPRPLDQMPNIGCYNLSVRRGLMLSSLRLVTRSVVVGLGPSSGRSRPRAILSSNLPAVRIIRRVSFSVAAVRRARYGGFERHLF